MGALPVCILTLLKSWLNFNSTEFLRKNLFWVSPPSDCTGKTYPTESVLPVLLTKIILFCKITIQFDFNHMFSPFKIGCESVFKGGATGPIDNSFFLKTSPKTLGPSCSTTAGHPPVVQLPHDNPTRWSFRWGRLLRRCAKQSGSAMSSSTSKI